MILVAEIITNMRKKNVLIEMYATWFAGVTNALKLVFHVVKQKYRC